MRRRVVKDILGSGGAAQPQGVIDDSRDRCPVELDILVHHRGSVNRRGQVRRCRSLERRCGSGLAVGGQRIERRVICYAGIEIDRGACDPGRVAGVRG